MPRRSSVRFAIAVVVVTAGCATSRGAPAPAEGELAASRVTVMPGHVLFRVAPGGVEPAARAFETAGFTVVRGGPPKDLVNAMIYFDDGWFIELFGLGEEARVVIPLFFGRFIDPVMASRFGRLVRARQIGWLDWSVDVDDIERAKSVVEEGQVAVSRVRTFQRTQEDGTSVSWELAMPGALEVPFLKSAYRGHTPIPPAARVHRNGATGIDRLVFSTPRLEEARRNLERLAESHDGELMRIAGVTVSVERGEDVAIRELSLCTAGAQGSRVELMLGRQWNIELSPCSDPGDTNKRGSEISGQPREKLLERAAGVASPRHASTASE